MKNWLMVPAVLMACLAAAPAASTDKVTGDYVEARTASVFAGACHYNGELVTIGQDAVMAWNITAGSWKGTNLSGVRAMAAVTSPANLGDEKGERKCELVVDTSASEAQVAAFADMVRAQAGGQIGKIATIKRAAVEFKHDGGYVVKSEGFASMTVQPMPDAECCKQPSLVWYSPLFKVEGRKVGYTEKAAYTAGTLGEPWQRVDENDAFYGTFAF